MRSLLFIEDPGLWLSVRAGELALRQRDGRYVHLDGHIRVIVAAARGFCVTCAAIRYCSARHIELFVSDDVAAFVSLLAPEARGDARRAALKVREHQFRAAFNPRRTVEIARAIIGQKIKVEGHRREAGQAFLTELQRTKTVDDVRHVEAASAQIWWRQWAGFQMRFPEPTVAAEWRSWPGRYIGRRQGRLGELAAQFTARGAVHPMQAMLNFSTAITTARLTRAIVAMGLDPCFGFLHDGRKPGRLSLVWDAIEPLRPKLVKAVFKYAGTHEFERRDFLVLVHKITLERTVRLAPELTKEIATEAVSVSECIKTVRGLVELL
jgi:CRISPR-associated endonuclease Cas1